MEDPERRDQARKRKKWKQNLSLVFTDEEDLSSDSDVNNKTTCLFETNEAVALRFPYPMVSDDSDNDENLNYYPRVSQDINHVHKSRKVALSSDDSIELSEENESYKHKKRKSNQEANCKRTQPPRVVNLKRGNSGYDTTRSDDTDDTTRQVSKTSISLKRTSFNTKNKVKRNKESSRFLDSSSEEEVIVKKPVTGHNKFKRIKLLSSSSDDEETNNKLKEKRTHFLSSSSDDSNKEESIDSKNCKRQTQKPGLDTAQTNLGLRKNNKVHSISSSSESEDNTKSHSVPTKVDYNHKVPEKKALLLCSSTQQSNKSPLPQNSIETEENQKNVGPSKVDEKKADIKKGINKVQRKSHLNADLWKRIANVQFKPPNCSSTHQSYLKTLKKQLTSSNTPSTKVPKSTTDNTFQKRDNVKSSKESCSNSKVIKKDVTQERQRRLTCYPQKLSGETSTSDNTQAEQPIDLNINMNVQIICSPSVAENMNTVDNSTSNSPAENNNKSAPDESDINFSLTHQENRKTEISSCKKIKFSSNAERNRARQSKYNDSNELKGKTQERRKISLKQKVSKNDIQLKKEKKETNTKVEKIVTTENCEPNTDVLGTILLEMDNNPFKVKQLLPKKALNPFAERLVWGSFTSDLHSTPSQLHLPLNLQSPEKENESINHKIPVENKLGFSKEVIVNVGSSSKPSISQTVSSIEQLENPNINIQKSIQHNNTLIRETNSSEKALVPSFYSVNSEDYNHGLYEIPNNKNAESSSHLVSNTSNTINKSQPQIPDNINRTYPHKEVIKEHQSIINESRLTELSDSVSNTTRQQPTSHLYNNSLETIEDRLYLENKSSAERNLKNKEYVQDIIDKLTKSLTNNKPSITEKSLVREGMENISIPNRSNCSNLGHTRVSSSKQPTTPLEVDTESNKKVKKSPDKENNVISNSKPSKGIRIRYGGNVYRLPGKENVIDSNEKVKQQKEIIPSRTIDSKNLKVTSSLNKSTDNNNVSSPCSGVAESDSADSSNSSEDSSDDSSSSEDKLVVTEKSSSGNSSSESTSEDEKDEPAVQSVKVPTKVSTEGEINKDVNNKMNSKNINALVTSATSSKVSELDEPAKNKTKTLSLDELLGFNKKSKTKASLQTGTACNTVSGDAIVLSSSSEPESIEGTNYSICKSKSVIEKEYTVSDKSSENNSMKTSDCNRKNQNPNLNVPIENKVWKIRVRSFEELGISNACPLPDNALQPSRLLAVESKEQSLQAQPVLNNAVDVGLSSTSTENVGSVVKTKARGNIPIKGGPSPLNGHKAFLNKETKKQNVQSTPLFHDESNAKLNDPNVQQLSRCSSETAVHMPRINTVSRGESNSSTRTNSYSYNHNVFASTNTCFSNQPDVSKQNICSQIPSTSNISAQNIVFNVNNQPYQESEGTVNQRTPGPAETLKAGKCLTVWRPIPRGSILAVVRAPTVNQTATDNSTIATSSSCSTSDKQENRNQPLTELTVKEGVFQILNPNEPDSKMQMENFFFNLCDKLFCEVVQMKIPKLVDDLHLVISHDIMRNERLKKVSQLKCPETKEEEKRRTEKEFMETLKVRGQGFVPLFMTIVRKIEKDSMNALVIALYCKIVHQLEQIDPINCTYRFKLRLLVRKMLVKSNVNHEVCYIFSEDNTSFTSSFYFIESLLLKYDKFVINRNQKAIQSASDESNENRTEQISSQTENTERSVSSESTPSQAEKTTTVLSSGAQSSTSEQTAGTTHKSNISNVQYHEPSGMSSVNMLQPVGNLDHLLLGSFCKKASDKS